MDEVALQRSQSIGTKAMKAALRGKRVSDKEREALINAEGLDSIATIKEHLEAEAKEAESEGGNLSDLYSDFLGLFLVNT